MISTPEPALGHDTDQQLIVQATEYAVSLLPLADVDAYDYALIVRHRGGNRWAVLLYDHASLPDDRSDERLTTRRFDLDTALRLAKEAAPHITVNGRTAAEVYARTHGGGQE